VLEGWVPGSVRDGGPAAADALAELDELAAAAQPLRDVAARLHALARRPAPGS
jgi:S-adenosylmethionine-dependent methyltransferase